jgi:hypothetical protein
MEVQQRLEHSPSAHIIHALTYGLAVSTCTILIYSFRLARSDRLALHADRYTFNTTRIIIVSCPLPKLDLLSSCPRLQAGADVQHTQSLL